MKELKDIMAAVTALPVDDSRYPAALVTVVRAEGSSYRRAGARMLVLASGETIGVISGGCLDADVRERSDRVMANGDATTARYDSTAPEDVVLGLGLGCNGIVDVIIEPVDSQAIAAASAADSSLASVRTSSPVALTFIAAHAALSGQQVALLTIVDPDRNDGSGQRRIAVNEHEAAISPPGSVEPRIATRLTEIARASLAAGPEAAGARHIDLSLGDGADGRRALLERFSPPHTLLVVGAGDDAVPLVEIAARLGWQVRVTDHRAHFARPERFPTASSVELVRPEEAIATLEAGTGRGRTAVVLINHSFELDRLALDTMLPFADRGIDLVSVLGPRSRIERIYEALEDAGTTLTPTDRAAIHGPAGLDIGAETPEEIALAVVADIQASLTGASAGRLNDREGPIHERVGRISVEVAPAP